MVVFIPFQVLRLKNLLEQQYQSKSRYRKSFNLQKFSQLQNEIQNDIIRCINDNLYLGNITIDDATQLLELTNQLYEYIRADFGRKMEGDADYMKPLLPGALELPNDKYRFRIDELEKEIARYADENARFADENARFADENARFADENARFADENARFADENKKLKRRIAELEAGQSLHS